MPRWGGVLLTLVFSMACVNAAQAQGMWISTSTGAFNVPVRSMQELKFTETVRQGFDFSCGSAALATLLTYHYDRDQEASPDKGDRIMSGHPTRKEPHESQVIGDARSQMVLDA